jgi:methylenetetrahydrofolate dehydrogenase (NADP+)/methenyltetrahydrofolate cyclohydrolase
MLNQDESVHGIIIQLPLPSNLDPAEITNLVNSEKDVDGLSENSPFMPATARGVLNLLDYYDLSVEQKKITVMGRSKLVGSPIQSTLLERGALVNVVHSETKNPKDITRSADILIVAIGKPGLIDETYIKEGQVVVDVGITMKDGKILGDVDFEKVKDIVSAISPVPGGVGPLTVASLFQNLNEAYKQMMADIEWENS